MTGSNDRNAPPSEMDRVTVRVPKHNLEAVEEAVDSGEFHTKSQAIRAAIRDRFDTGGAESDV